MRRPLRLDAVEGWRAVLLQSGAIARTAGPRGARLPKGGALPASGRHFRGLMKNGGLGREGVPAASPMRPKFAPALPPPPPLLTRPAGRGPAAAPPLPGPLFQEQKAGDPQKVGDPPKAAEGRRTRTSGVATRPRKLASPDRRPGPSGARSRGPGGRPREPAPATGGPAPGPPRGRGPRAPAGPTSGSRGHGAGGPGGAAVVAGGGLGAPEAAGPSPALPAPQAGGPEAGGTAQAQGRKAQRGHAARALAGPARLTRGSPLRPRTLRGSRGPPPRHRPGTASGHTSPEG